MIEDDEMPLIVPNNVDKNVTDDIARKFTEIQQLCGQRDKLPTQLEITLVEVHKQAAKEDEEPMHDLCYRYKYGRGAVQNYALAREWCTKAADKGVDSSQVLLAEM